MKSNNTINHLGEKIGKKLVVVAMLMLLTDPFASACCSWVQLVLAASIGRNGFPSRSRSRGRPSDSVAVAVDAEPDREARSHTDGTTALHIRTLGQNKDALESSSIIFLKYSDETTMNRRKTVIQQPIVCLHFLFEYIYGNHIGYSMLCL